jgi:predicted transcriptional regulator
MSDIFVGGLENIDGDLVADGTISAGDLVDVTGDNQVKAASTTGADGYGVALYDAVDGEAVAVATVGAKVIVNSLNAVSAGAALTSNGGNTAGEVQTASSSGDFIVGKATVGGANGTCTMLITLGGDNH